MFAHARHLEGGSESNPRRVGGFSGGGHLHCLVRPTLERRQVSICLGVHDFAMTFGVQKH